MSNCRGLDCDHDDCGATRGTPARSQTLPGQMKLWCDCHGYTTCPNLNSAEVARPLSPDFQIPSEYGKSLANVANVASVLEAVRVELTGAMSKFPGFNSAHEGWAVLMEEVDELWDEVRAKQGARHLDDMRAEAIQVAAMAVRFILDVCTPENVQK